MYECAIYDVGERMWWSGQFRTSWAPKGVSVGSLAGGEHTRTLERK